MRRWSCGAAIAACGLVLAGCAAWVVGPDAATTPKQIFDTVWTQFDQHYSFFELKGTNWDSLYAVYEPRAAEATSDSALFDAIAGLLGQLDDVHVRLSAPIDTFEYQPNTEVYFSSRVVFRNYISDAARTQSRQIHYGRIRSDPTIGYIDIPTFVGTGWTNDIDDALDSLAGVRALIIDIRNNGGGDEENALSLAARFADQRRTFATVRYRNGPRHSDFTPPIPQVVAPGGATHFGGPVVVLTNRRVYSAAEDFLLAMRALPQVMTVGDTTGGASGNPLARELPNGWSYQLSEWVEYLPNGQTFEGIGLVPDVVVQGSARALEHGVDVALHVAVRVVEGR
ncbi:MAG TPA: S41 family peptidase [Gemmatimonadaceae bacterium]|nr:S41 family peptidase [Gemmatimonadaceae bacterium]